MKRWSLALLAPMLLAAGPTSLIVGVVHDQYGQPIAGATVRIQSQTGTTDAAGTFAVPADAASGFAIVTCEYCRTTRVPVQPGEPVVAIVSRNDALANESPTERDIAALRYSSAASALTLSPYAVLNESSTPLPGARVTLYGLSTFWGGLTIDDGIPSYDVASASSTFSFLPALATQRAQYGEPQDAFRYGDNAGAGTFFIDTRPERGMSGDLAGGSERAVRLGENDGTAAGSLDASATSLDSRDRADATIDIPFGDDILSATAIAASSRQFDRTNKSLDSAWNAARLAFRHDGATPVQASLTFDNSGYNGTLYEGVGASAGWSDFQADASVQSSGAVHAFAGAGWRSSTGFYSDPTLGSLAAGSIAQTHADAGVQFTSSSLSASAGAGLFSYAYNGGSGGTRDPLGTHIVSPSIAFNYTPAGPWSAAVSSSEYFRVPSIAEVYAPPVATSIDPQKSPATIASIAYRDMRRLRFELIDVMGADHASGADLAWEIAPNVSLRAWTLEFQDIPEVTTATVNSFWATYENPAGVRFDAVERRDLIDTAENQHLDASVSFPVGPHVRWFASTERRAFSRFYRTGLELTP